LPTNYRQHSVGNAHPTEAMTDTESHDHTADEHACYVHVMPVWVLIAVFAALIVLTGLTVLFHEPFWQALLGRWGLIVAMGIATIKATLVALYFMHLRYDKPINGVILLSALVFATLFISLTVLDTVEYQPDVQRYDQRNGP